MNTPTYPDSHERDGVARLLPGMVERDLPSARRRQLQEFVMDEIQQDLRQTGQAARRPRRWRPIALTSALAGGLAVAVAIGVGVVGVGPADRGGVNQGSGPTRAATTTTAKAPVAQTFELVAVHAAAQPYTPPRPDQWIYTKERCQIASNIAKRKEVGPEIILEKWLSVDGKKRASINKDRGGKLDIWPQENDYPQVATLPTDPQAVLDWLRAHLEKADDLSVDDMLFRSICNILEAHLLPPDVTAAMWRAAALIPGITQSNKTVRIHGRDVIAVGRVQQGWMFEQLLVDPDTYEFVGYRQVAAKDHTSPGADGDPPFIAKAGDVMFVFTRLAAKIVDHAGQTH